MPDSLAETWSARRGKGEQESYHAVYGAKQYSAEDLEVSARSYAAGAKINRVVTNILTFRSERFGIEPNFLKSVALRKPGPPPILREKMECDLLGWVVGMQKNGLLYNREAWLEKANVIYWAKYGIKRSTGFLTLRWVS